MPYIGIDHYQGDSSSNFIVLDDIKSYTATFDGSSSLIVDLTNDSIEIPLHRFVQGQRVTYSKGGGPVNNIGGLAHTGAYYVIKDGKDLSSDAIKALDFSYEPHFDIKVFLEAHERNTNGNVRSTVWPEFGLGRVYIN